MMIDPPIDKLIDKVGCKYELVCVTAKRAKEVVDRKGEVLSAQGINPVTYAAKEFYTGSVVARTED